MSAAQPPALTRRNVLKVATVSAAGIGIAAATWPFIDQLNPDAATAARGDFVYVDAIRLAPDQPRLLRWRQWPVFAVSRSPAALDALQERALLARLTDPESHAHQQPPYARNWHRSQRPAFAVLIGSCTRCACVLRPVPREASATDALHRAGSFSCDCCGSAFDVAGRSVGGIARFNLAVPPHSVAGNELRIGKNPPGESYVFAATERG